MEYPHWFCSKPNHSMAGNTGNGLTNSLTQHTNKHETLFLYFDCVVLSSADPHLDGLHCTCFLCGCRASVTRVATVANQAQLRNLGHRDKEAILFLEIIMSTLSLRQNWKVRNKVFTRTSLMYFLHATFSVPIKIQIQPFQTR